MRATKTIPLTTPLVGHTGPIKQIVLREPTFDEVMQHDSPYLIAGADDGTPFVAVDMTIVKKYVDILVVEPQDSALLSQASGKVALLVKDAILGFFRPDVPEAEGLPNSQTNSPSAASTSAQAKSES